MKRIHVLPRVIVVLLAVAFTGMVAVGAGVAIRGIWRQMDAQKRFVPVQATVVGSEVKTSRGKRGSTRHRAAILCQYVVDGRTYTGDRESFGIRFENTSRSRAEAVVAAHPRGSTITVHVDPDNPISSVRRVGVEGADLGILIFLTPFAGVSVFLWAAAAQACRREATTGPGRLLRADDGRVASLRLTTTSPAMVAGFAIAFAGFGAIVAFLLALGGAAPMWGVLLLGCGVLLAGTLGYWIAAIRQASGRCDLHVDRDQRRLILPARLARSLGAEVPFEAVQAVEVEVSRERTKRGSRETHHAVLVVADPKGEIQRGRLLACGGDDEAQRLARWLRDELGLPAN